MNTPFRWGTNLGAQVKPPMAKRNAGHQPGLPESAQYENWWKDLVAQSMERIAVAFMSVETDLPGMTVRVLPGSLDFGASVLDMAEQTTAAFAAPTTNDRIDRIVLDEATGVISVVAGTPAAEPTPPAVPAGKRRSAQVHLYPGMTAITMADITDERALLSGWRTQAAADNSRNLATTAYLDSKLGVANGIATLDSTGFLTQAFRLRIPQVSQTLTGTLNLTATDALVQNIDCNGADRIANLPSTELAADTVRAFRNTGTANIIRVQSSNGDFLSEVHPGGYVVTQSNSTTPTTRANYRGLSRTQYRKVFTSSGTLERPLGCTFGFYKGCGGGGGGGGGGVGGDDGGGGGGGGARYRRNEFVDLMSANSYAVTIGAGGAGGPAQGVDGTAGGSTTVGSIITLAGGGAGHNGGDSNGGGGGTGIHGSFGDEAYGLEFSAGSGGSLSGTGGAGGANNGGGGGGSSSASGGPGGNTFIARGGASGATGGGEGGGGGGGACLANGANGNGGNAAANSGAGGGGGRGDNIGGNGGSGYFEILM